MLSTVPLLVFWVSWETLKNCKCLHDLCWREGAVKRWQHAQPLLLPDKPWREQRPTTRGNRGPGFSGTLSPSPVFQEHDAFQQAKGHCSSSTLQSKWLASSFLCSALSSSPLTTPNVLCHCPIAPRREEKSLRKEIPDKKSRDTHYPGFRTSGVQ